MRRRVDFPRLGALAAALVLAGCASKRSGSPDNEPTIATLAKREIVVAPDAGVKADTARTIAAYRKFLEVSPKARELPEALRRLGDLEMDLADEKTLEAGAAPDYKTAIAQYQDLLKRFPKDPGNDRVLYQLARAHEQAGQLEVALKTLDRLVAEHPQTRFAGEAQFRRGEMLFATRAYPQAERAFATVLGVNEAAGFHERALYMQGWSQFKQAKLEDSLQSFFAVLDRKVANRGDALDIEKIEGLTRGDRELVEDSFRVTSIALANLQGAESIPPYITNDTRRSYEFRVYDQLAALYLKQERTKDAADTLGLFAKRQPLHAQAPVLQARVIDIYLASGFGTLALDAKRAYASRYGVDSEFRRANPEGWERAKPLLKANIADLARHHHAQAQKTKATAEVDEAVKWYRTALVSFPDDAEAPEQNFLLGELLFEFARYAEAAEAYEKTAYGYPRHAKSADAGYAALLAHAQTIARAAPADKVAARRAGVSSALRFAGANPSDARTTGVLTDAAEKLYALGDGAAAVAVAQQVLQRDALPAQRRVAWTVTAYQAFDRGAFPEAEAGLREVLALVPERDPARNELTERLAASVYKQGEAARQAGQGKDAVGHFERVAALAPNSTVRAAAQFDAATAMIGLKDWDGAARLLDDFRGRFPNHPLAGEVPGKLAVVQLERGQWALAAAEFERIAAAQADPAIARDALWQAAELNDKAAGPNGSRATSARIYEAYLRRFPMPLEPAVEARWRLATIAQAERNAPKRLALLREARAADAAGGDARTARTRVVGGLATLALAEPLAEAYRAVPLAEPLARQLKLKKAKMEDVLKAYAQASEYGVAEVTTAATFQTAAIYQDFGRALITSQRPKSLKKTEREQYDLMLEEQAFPFEEKAIELHETNARRPSEGLWNDWIARSLKSLAELRPVRYGKSERVSTGGAPSAEAIPALEKAAAAQNTAAAWSDLGIAYRLAGQFDKARNAYERALAADPASQPATLNLGILADLYQRDATRALELYERAQTLAQDATVAKWIVDLRNRKPAGGTTPAAVAAKKEPA